MASQPVIKLPSLLTWDTLALSTNADGITGSDVADLGGYSPCAIELSSLCTDANYSFQAAIDSTSVMKTLITSTGGIVSVGTTAAGVTTNRIIALDPTTFQGIRFLQVVSGTTASPIANATGATARLGLKPIASFK